MKKLQQKAKKEVRVAQYRSTYLKSTAFAARNGKTVYISKEFHQNISRIVFMLGDGKITMSDYLHSVLQQHFSEFSSEIEHIY